MKKVKETETIINNVTMIPATLKIIAHANVANERNSKIFLLGDLTYKKAIVKLKEYLSSISVF